MNRRGRIGWAAALVALVVTRFVQPPWRADAPRTAAPGSAEASAVRAIDEAGSAAGVDIRRAQSSVPVRRVRSL